MPESIKTRFWRYGLNFFPAFRGTGAKITYVSHDFREIKLRLPLNWRTKNYIGTIFGGSMFAATDPMYLVMLIKVLGPDYIVWDKESKIRYKKPGRTTLYAKATLEEAEVEFIRNELASQSKIDRIYQIDLVDAHNVVHASIEKKLHIRKKK
ncbi:hypothetical protein MNBD_GAMMA16-288 [hydrothermal vent metagenome]|uniref:DUF4442 domain-containing protein n=1 Tax=hydrothermal vent metagenome TaxID=652676 RepID=A0A3B0ZW76_9ZZZZ